MTPGTPGPPPTTPARKIVPIVEGDGEENAVPVLLYKLLHERLEVYDLFVGTARKAHGRDNLLKPGGVERFLRLALLEPGCAAILIVLDADDDCPRQIAEALTARIRAAGSKCPVAVVVARCMFECWLLASLDTIAGKVLASGPGIPADAAPPPDPEAANGKAELNQLLRTAHGAGRAYKETSDQAAMARHLDVGKAAERSRSFRRLAHAVEELRQAVEGGATDTVTPDFTPPLPTLPAATRLKQRGKGKKTGG